MRSSPLTASVPDNPQPPRERRNYARFHLELETYSQICEYKRKSALVHAQLQVILIRPLVLGITNLYPGSVRD